MCVRTCVYLMHRHETAPVGGLAIAAPSSAAPPKPLLLPFPGSLSQPCIRGLPTNTWALPSLAVTPPVESRTASVWTKQVLSLHARNFWTVWILCLIWK